MLYENTLVRIEDPLPLLADHPDFVAPLECEDRFLAPPLVNDTGGELLVRSWRYWYNARGTIEFENRLDASATAIVCVHPWGIDDGHGLRTPEPAGVAFFCTRWKNELSLGHIREVVSPFIGRLRPHVAVVGYSLPGTEDEIRRLLYASIETPPEKTDVARGEELLAEALANWEFRGEPLASQLTLADGAPVRTYFEQSPSTDASDRYNGAGYWDLPMPVVKDMERDPNDLVFYDGEGYPKVRDFLKQKGIRHILLTGYCTDMCVISTTCGYQNLSQDFNLFLVGDATLATFPGSTTPKYATQVALANAALEQTITQCRWVQRDGGENG